jgi:ABC-type amino acid transport substrate-binding protein
VRSINAATTLEVALQEYKLDSDSYQKEINFEYKLIKYFCAHINAEKCEITFIPRQRIARSTQALGFDIGLPAGMNGHQTEQHSEPYYFRHLVLVVNRNLTEKKIKQKTDLKRVNIISAFGVKRELKLVNSGDLTKHYQVPREAHAIELFKLGRFEALIAEYKSLHEDIDMQKTYYEYVELFAITPLSAIIPDKKLRARFNEFIATEKSKSWYFESMR